MRGMESVRDLFDMYEHTPGSLLFGLGGTRAAAVKRNLPEIVASCDTALAAAQTYFNTDAAWERTKNQPKAVGDGEAAALDPQIDRVVTGIQETAANLIRSLPEGHPLAIAGTEFLRKALPNGAEGITKLRHPEQLVAVQQLLGRCSDANDLLPYVQKLGLAPLVERLRELCVRFEAALRNPSAGETTWDKLKAANFEAQERLAELVGKITGTFNLRTAEHIQARRDLLSPIMQQEERIAEARKQRRPLTDVDPNTGEPVVTPPANPANPVPPVDHG